MTLAWGPPKASSEQANMIGPIRAWGIRDFQFMLWIKKIMAVPQECVAVYGTLKTVLSKIGWITMLKATCCAIRVWNGLQWLVTLTPGGILWPRELKDELDLARWMEREEEGHSDGWSFSVVCSYLEKKMASHQAKVRLIVTQTWI